MEDLFKKRCKYVSENPSLFTEDQLSELYGYYKQSVYGNAPRSSPSMIFNHREFQKWVLWDRCRDMPSQEAMHRYIRLTSDWLMSH